MKKILFWALVCAMTSLISCDKINEATSRDFKVNNVAFDFTATTAALSTQSMTRSAEALSSFTVTREVNISELGSADVMEYASKISKVVVNSASLSVTTSPTGSYTVTDLTLVADGVSGTLTVPSYTIGGAFTPPAGMDTYIGSFITKLLTAKKVTVTVSGKTDAPAGTTLNISYESDLLMTASLF